MIDICHCSQTSPNHHVGTHFEVVQEVSPACLSNGRADGQVRELEASLQRGTGGIEPDQGCIGLGGSGMCVSKRGF